MIDDPELLMFLQSEEARATDTTLNDERVTALAMYRGDLFGDEVDGRSKLRTRDVAEVVDYMLASVLRTMVSGDKVVEFEPSNPGEDDIAQQITDRIHWNFLREQNGYQILRDGLKAGLLEKSGVWKSFVERPKVAQPQRINADDIERLGGDVVAATPIEGMFDAVPVLDEDGQPTVDEFGEPAFEAVQVYDATVMVPGKPKFVDVAIPNEQFFVSPDTRTLPTSPYHGDWSAKSLSELMDLGYPYEDVATLWGDNGTGQQLRDARDEGRTEKESAVNRANLGRIVILREEYARYVWEGRYQLIRVHRVGTSILSVEAVKDQPYTLWCPFPMQHRLIGQSLADKSMDIQVVRSHMLRQAMDALYIANAPRIYVDMNQLDDNTLDDVLDVAPGGIIRGKGPNGVQVFDQPFAADPAFKAMEIMAGEKESRTGITRLNQGLDADALNKTATGTALMQAQGQQIEELIAREAANAIGEMFEKKLHLMIENMAPHEFRTDGKVVQMDPAQWPDDLRLAVRVGLGSGNKDKKLQGIGLLKQSQAEAIQVDPRLVTPEKVFETAKLVTSTLGLGPATQYFNDPAEMPPQQEQPNPEVIEAQAKAEREMQAQQFDQQLRTQEMQMKRWQAEQEAQLNRERAEAEWALAQSNADRDYELKQQQVLMQASTNASIAQNREGGRLDA